MPRCFSLGFSSHHGTVGITLYCLSKDNKLKAIRMNQARCDQRGDFDLSLCSAYFTAASKLP